MTTTTRTRQLHAELANLRRQWTTAKAVADQRPGDAFADLFGEDHWITQRSRQCDHPQDYDPDDEPDGTDLPDCAGHHSALARARDEMARIERIARRLQSKLDGLETADNPPPNTPGSGRDLDVPHAERTKIDSPGVASGRGGTPPPPVPAGAGHGWWRSVGEPVHPGCDHCRRMPYGPDYDPNAGTESGADPRRR